VYFADNSNPNPNLNPNPRFPIIPSKHHISRHDKQNHNGNRNNNNNGRFHIRNHDRHSQGRRLQQIRNTEQLRDINTEQLRLRKQHFINAQWVCL
jgi:hypothetical protein